jgi:hypothetical protein
VNNNGSSITAYVVSASPGHATTQVDGSTTSGTVTGLKGGVTYTFTVRAVSQNGDSTESTVSNAVIVQGPPQAPTSPTSVSRNGAATISWTPPTNPGSAPISGYVVTPWVNGANLAPQEFDTTATTQSITGLTNGLGFSFTVAAINAEGTGPPSVYASMIYVGIPNPPTGVKVQGDAANRTAGSLTVTYAAGPDNGSKTTSFVARCTSSNGGVTRTAAVNGSTPQPLTVSGNGPPSSPSTGIKA